MKKLSFITLIALMMSFTATQPSIYERDFKFTSLEGKEMSLNQFKGKKVLIVNTASKCGYTKQYKDLQELHKSYGDKVVIIDCCRETQDPQSLSDPHLPIFETKQICKQI